ncbi:hypothetical protein AJ88_45230 [Mesorhizobium amorphae CCBAU 01583]|nr:hypothetical protein AJ88_45230 [Mesorhizobium amorphae CCBAU 01583]
MPAIAAGAAAAGESPARSSGLRHALIIDDEPDVAGSLSDILELMGLKSRVVAAWTSAAGILAGHMPPDIVFSDLRMPGTSGIAIYRELLAERPDLAQRFVLVTGDLIGAKAEIEALPAPQRPQILEKPSARWTSAACSRPLPSRSPWPPADSFPGSVEIRSGRPDLNINRPKKRDSRPTCGGSLTGALEVRSGRSKHDPKTRYLLSDHA